MHVNITVHFSTLMTTLASITFTAVRKVAYLYSEPANSTLRVHFVEHGYITIHGRRGMLMIMVYKPPFCVRGPSVVRGPRRGRPRSIFEKSRKKWLEIQVKNRAKSDREKKSKISDRGATRPPAADLATNGKTNCFGRQHFLAEGISRW